jgi:MOSC domain-containing protein YiiM
MSSRGVVVAVNRDARHDFSKRPQLSIELVEGLGVAGDAHLGVTVQHRSRVAHDPAQPNLRQVHLIHAELLDQLRESGFDVSPGGLGENITTSGIDLLTLPAGTRLTLGASAVIEITGLRNPCRQIDVYRPGLMKAVSERDASGARIRNPGVMAVVIAGGPVQPGDPIVVDVPAPPHHPLKNV